MHTCIYSCPHSKLRLESMVLYSYHNHLYLVLAGRTYTTNSSAILAANRNVQSRCWPLRSSRYLYVICESVGVMFRLRLSLTLLVAPRVNEKATIKLTNEKAKHTHLIIFVFTVVTILARKMISCMLALALFSSLSCKPIMPTHHKENFQLQPVVCLFSLDQPILVSLLLHSSPLAIIHVSRRISIQEPKHHEQLPN